MLVRDLYLCLKVIENVQLKDIKRKGEKLTNTR